MFSDKSIILLLAKLPLSFPLHILTIYHKVPTSQNSIAQRAEDEISASRKVDTRQYLVGRWRARPRRLISCSRAWLSSGTPILSRQRQVERSDFLFGYLVVTCLFCMAVTASEVYKFNAEKLRQLCSEKGLDNEGPVRLLRQRLVRHLTETSMARKQDT